MPGFKPISPPFKNLAKTLQLSATEPGDVLKKIASPKHNGPPRVDCSGLIKKETTLCTHEMNLNLFIGLTSSQFEIIAAL